MSYVARYRPLVDDWEAFTASLARPLPTCIWANPLKTTPAALERRMADDGIELRPVGWREGTYILPDDLSPGGRVEFISGLYQVQEEAALPAVDLLAPQPGERIIDLCAAPGNKTAQAAAAMKGVGTVVANDRSYGRLRAVRAALDRLGLTNVVVLNQNAITMPDIGTFDRVLADVPCSCEGTIRKNPSALEDAAKMTISEMAGVQAAILRRGVEICRDGGVIIYATCTFAPEENEAVVDRILGEFPGQLELMPTSVDGFRSTPGITSWGDDSYDPSLAQAMRVWPHHNDTGGFFIAKLRKVGS